MVVEIGNLIGGKRRNTSSGRLQDIFNPATGQTIAKLGLSREAVENAKAAQPEWAATNPQRRARVMMKFVQLLNRDLDKLAEALSREHGKTIPDARGDVIRGMEVAEFTIGAPHLLKGEFSEGAGPDIDIYSMHAPTAGGGCRDYPVQLSGDDPDVEILPGDRRRKRLYPQAVRAHPDRSVAAGRIDD